MVIDFHTHTFPIKIAATTVSCLCDSFQVLASTDGTVEGLCVSMDNAGIDMSVILPVATSPYSVPRINEAAAALNVHVTEKGMLSFGTIHPDTPFWKSELIRVARLGMPGIKLHPLDQGTNIDDIRYIRIMERASELGLIILIHCGRDVRYPGIDRSSPEMLLRVIRQLGPERLVLAHMGGFQNWEQVEALLTDTGVYVDTAVSLGTFPRTKGSAFQPIKSMEETQFVRLVRKFGADKVLFGTDCPWSDQGEYLKKFLDLPLTEDEQRAILYRNALSLLKKR